MMRAWVLAAMAAAALAGCGVDGAPERPGRAAAGPGVSVTGSVGVGLAGGS